MSIQTFGGASLEDILQHIARSVRSNNGDIRKIYIDDSSDIEDSRNEAQEFADRFRTNISKLWWVDRRKGDDAEEVVVNIIAPFLQKDTFSATITNIDNREFVEVSYQNGAERFNKCEAANFKTDVKIGFKFEACSRGYKINKKAIKTTYKDGIVSIVIPSEKPKSKKDSEFTFGLN